MREDGVLRDDAPPLGATIETARIRAYEAVSRIHFEGCHYRRDIALNAVAE